MNCFTHEGPVNCVFKTWFGLSTTCTKVIVSKTKESYLVLPTTFMQLILESPILIFSDILPIKSLFPDKFYPKNIKPCSVVIYDDHIDFHNISRDWVTFLPGMSDDNTHIFFHSLNQRSSAIVPIEELTPATKSLLNILFVSPTRMKTNLATKTEINFLIETLDATGQNTVKVGTMKCDDPNDHNKCFILGNLMKFNRWDFHGSPLTIAMAGQLQSPTQKDFDSKMRNEYPRTFNYSMYFSSLVMMISQFAEGVNSTASVARFDTASFGGFDPVSGKWFGLVKEVIDGNVHTCIGLAATQKNGRFLSQAMPFIYDDISFITSLPRQPSASVFFFFESFHFDVWLIFIAMAGVIIGFLTILNRNSFPSIVGIILKPLIDQAAEEAVIKKYFPKSCAPLVVIAGWLMSFIVIGSLFKSRLTSVLVEPGVTVPPQTIRELAQSDYHVGTLLYKETEFEAAIEDLQELTFVKQLSKKFLHYRPEVKDEVW